MKGSRSPAAAALALLALLPAGKAVVAASVAAQGGPQEERLRLLREVWDVVGERYALEVSPRDLVYAWITGALATLDPFSAFLEPEAFADLRRKQDRRFFGIGAVVGLRSGLLTVIHPLPDSPAERAGLAPGDVIRSIDGEGTLGLSEDEAARRLGGAEGSRVRLTVARPGRDLTFSVERSESSPASVRHAYMLAPATGYIEVTEFSRGTAAAVADALLALERQGMERLVLDLRNNPGGLLDEVVEVANLFLPEGAVIVRTRRRAGLITETFTAAGSYHEVDLPLVVLVDEGTASAAEILSGAIQDHDRGLLVGAPTWGKGLVQTVWELSDGSGLILTTTEYFTPSGRRIQRPDRLGNLAGPQQPQPSPDHAYLTDLGRKVYGGGGIVPDVPARSAERSPFDLALLEGRSYLQFAVDYRRRRPDLDPDRVPGGEALAELGEWLVEKGFATRREVEEGLSDEETRRFALMEIHAEVVNLAVGGEAAHRVRTGGDRQVKIALDHFDRAAALMESRRARHPGSPASGSETRRAPSPRLRHPPRPPSP